MGEKKPTITNKQKTKTPPPPTNQIMSMNISVVCCKYNIFNKEIKSEILA